MSDAVEQGGLPDSKLKELRAFFEKAFTPTQLARFLSEHDLDSVASEVAENQGARPYSSQIVAELNRQGRINRKFFAHLLGVRKHQEAWIRSIEASLLEPQSEGEKGWLLSSVQIEELADSAGDAGLLSYDVQVELLLRLDPALFDQMKLGHGSRELLHSTLVRLNEMPGKGPDTLLARWLTLALPIADARGFSGPYRRALEVLLGAEFSVNDELDADFPAPREGTALQPDMLSIDFLSLGLKAAASTCWMKLITYREGEPEKFMDGRPLISGGTGWLITPSLLVTAWHNLVGPYHRGRAGMSDVHLQVRSMTCEFDYENGINSGTTHRGSRLLGWSEDSDIALVRLAGETQRPGLRPRPLSLGPLGENDRISMIHHGFSRRKLLGLRGRVLEMDTLKPPNGELPAIFRLSERLLHDLPSAPGSSGAPLFDDDWRLVGFVMGSGYFHREDKKQVRFGFGTPLDAIRRFFAGTHAEYDDPKLFQTALKEIQTTLEED